jgi:hypothetical protein
MYKAWGSVGGEMRLSHDEVVAVQETDVSPGLDTAWSVHGL